jgi:hypothetical protein
MHVLRAEKGYVIVGQDTDGTLTPMTPAWPGPWAPEARFRRQALARPARHERAGAQAARRPLTEDPQEVLEEGAQIVADPDQPVPMTMLGHVTSSYHSATLGRSIAMAVIADGRARDGQVIHVPMPGRTIRARVTASTVFYDPEGAASMSDALRSPRWPWPAPIWRWRPRHVTASGVALTLAPASRWSLRARTAQALAGVIGRAVPARIGETLDGTPAWAGRMAGRPACRHRAARWRRAAGQRGGHFRARVVIR